ncbi:MAG: hypothetical protein JJU41_00770 [Bacteroidetes bacterium]|nr:hypothetical protein [Bacteroidota bacterium]MCH8525121.1 hypothetical protein [Balneolales bacterium]
MNITLAWEKTLFLNRFTFFIKNEKVGRYRYGFLKDNAEGTLLKHRFKFKKRGWFKSTTDIIDLSSSQVVGTIDLNKGLLKNKATVKLGNKVYHWNHSSVWTSKWELTEGSETRVKGKTNRLRGLYEVSDGNVVLILSSMYISRNFKDSNNLFTLIIAAPPVLKFIFNLLG